MKRHPMDSMMSDEIVITGRLIDASNASLLATLGAQENSPQIIYKPIAGERPLWDFPEGTLAHREVAAYIFSEELGLDLVPPTVLRDGPYGLGAVQLWCEQDDEWDVVSYAQGDTEALRQLVLFDALINNTDRKFGHILSDGDWLKGCDHGVTFHVEDKLRTVLWQFSGESLRDEDRLLIQRAEAAKWDVLDDLLSQEEIGAIRSRATRLLKENIYPLPSEEWPPVPWPPF